MNPDTFPNYAGKLSEMGKAVHGNRGLWIPPAAPGFDAQLIGGTTVVEHKDGATLRREFDTAMRSSPDAIGLISWNEFSENTHIEPSVNYGRRYLEVVADIQGGSVPQIPNFDSSDPGDIVSVFDFGRLVALGLLAALIFAGGAVIARRQPSVK